MLVKLGGSVITTKGGAKRVRRPALRRLAREVAGLPDIVVLHGAGSFGHALAKRARLQAGIQRPGQFHAAAQVSADVRALHLEVLRALQAAKARPYSLPPGQVAFCSGGELGAIALAPFELALRQGFTPVTCGDVVLDDKQGVAIVSADTVALHLAVRMKATRMVFATDVDGIFTAPPGRRGAQLLEECTATDLRAMELGGSRAADVTGGMAGKGRAIAAIAGQGCEVWVVNGLKAGRVGDALHGKAPVGTRVLAG
jgi:isopentenyl phosphate kinase